MWGVYQPLHQIDRDVIFESRDKRVATLSYVQYLVLMPCAIAGAVVSKRRKYPLLATGLWAGLATLTAAGTFGNTRYRTAGEVSIVLLASVAIVALAQRRSAEPRSGESGSVERAAGSASASAHVAEDPVAS